MNPLLVGGAVAVVLAGPPLYSLVEQGQMDGSSALLRGLLVAIVCATGVTYVMKLVTGYQKEADRNDQHDALIRAIEEAEAAAKRHAEAEAQLNSVQQNNRKP